MFDRDLRSAVVFDWDSYIFFSEQGTTWIKHHMRYMNVDVTDDGNCFYNAIYCALRERRNNVLFLVWQCLSKSTSPSQLKLSSKLPTKAHGLFFDHQNSFVRVLRTFAARYIEQTQVDNPVNQHFGTLTQVMKGPTGQANVTAHLDGLEGWYREILVDALHNPTVRPFLRARVAAAIRVDRHWANEVDIQAVQAVLSACGVSLRIVNVGPHYDPSLPINQPSHDQEIVLVNLNENHYNYTSIFEFLHPGTGRTIDEYYDSRVPQKRDVSVQKKTQSYKNVVQQTVSSRKASLSAAQEALDKMLSRTQRVHPGPKRARQADHSQPQPQPRPRPQPQPQPQRRMQNNSIHITNSNSDGGSHW